MLRPEPMAKVRITCHQANLKRVIDELYAAKAVHLTEHKKDELLDIGSPLAEHESFSQAILKIQSLRSLLAIEAGKSRSALSEQGLPKAAARVAALHAKAQALTERQKELDAELSALEAERQTFALAKAFALAPGQFTASSSLACLLGTIKQEEGLRERLEEITSRFSLDVKRVEGQLALFLAIEAGKKTEALQALSGAGFSEILLPERKGKAAAIVQALDGRIRLLRKRRDAAQKELLALSQKESGFLLGAEEAFKRAARKSGAPLAFGVTERTALITGWVPASKLASLRRRIDALTKGRMLFEELEIGEHEAGPVKLKNPKAVRPFQFLLDLYSLPSSHEIDPTLFLFLTFPLLFGFMLGDMGYGLTTLILFLWLKRKIPAGRELLNVMAWAAGWSILFGAVFGEFFGLEELGHFEIPHLLSRSHGVQELITISLIIGLLHMLMGLILGFINVAHHHGTWHAIKEKLGWMLLLPGLARLLVILGLIQGGAGDFLVNNLPGLFLIILAVVGVILLVMGEGVKGVIELPGILSNVLSYARLMALGIASVSLAIVINQFTDEFASQGGTMFIAGVAIFLVGHLVNIALGVIGPFLHSLRLHYVELFTKFFEGGGEEFRPFGLEAEE